MAAREAADAAEVLLGPAPGPAERAQPFGQGDILAHRVIIPRVARALHSTNFAGARGKWYNGLRHVDPMM